MKNFEIWKAQSKLRVSSNKLAVITGKWYKINKENRLCHFCTLNAIEDEFHFLTDRPNYKNLRKSPFKSNQDTEHIDLSWGNITKKWRELFSNGLLQLLYVLGKFIQTATASRENTQDWVFINLTSRKKKSQFQQCFYLPWFIFICYLFNLSCCRFFIYMFKDIQKSID